MSIHEGLLSPQHELPPVMRRPKSTHEVRQGQLPPPTPRVDRAPQEATVRQAARVGELAQPSDDTKVPLAQSKEFASRLLTHEQVFRAKTKWDMMSDDELDEGIRRLESALKEPVEMSLLDRAKFYLTQRKLQPRLTQVLRVRSARQARRTLEENDPSSLRQRQARSPFVQEWKGPFDNYGRPPRDIPEA